MAEGEIQARQPLASGQHRNRLVSLETDTIQGGICATLEWNLCFLGLYIALL